jgi:hypothetical protein
MKISFNFLIGILLLIILLSACSGPAPVRTNQPETTIAVNSSYPGPATTSSLNNPSQTAVYPPPVATADLSSYPAPTQVTQGENATGANPAYPAPAPSPTMNSGTPVKVVPFKINKPLVAGTTDISGSGPADIPITLADISAYGEAIGEGTINSNGTFSIKLSKPLVANQWIGVTYSNLTGTKWVASNFDDPGFRGDSPQTIPLVGFFFDTAEVAEK